MITNIKEYIMENEFCIHIFDNKINIVNYIDIYGFDNNNIIIKHKKGTVNIKGNNLSISKLLDNEILIIGNFNSVELR